MHHHFDNHHIVKTQEEMKNKVIELLDNKRLNQDPVLIYPIKETCEKILSLYS